MLSENILQGEMDSISVKKGRRAWLVALISSAVLVVLYFLPSLGLLRNSFWFFAINTYFPRTFITIQFLLAIAVFILFFIPKNGLNLNIPIPPFQIAVVLLFMVFSILLQESISLYGDGMMFKKSIEVYTPVHFAELLTLFIYRAVYLVLPRAIRSGETAYRMVNTLVGFLAIIGYIKFTQREEEKFQPLLLILFAILGINVMFFGHIENYAPGYCLTIFFLLRLTSPKPSLTLLALALGTAVALQIVALALLPPFIIYVVKERRESIRGSFWLKMISVLLIPIIVTFLLGMRLGHPPRALIKNLLTTSLVLKEYSIKDYWVSVIDFNRWIDILNIFFLNLPTGLVFATLIVQGKSGKGLFNDRYLKFLLFNGLTFFIFLIFFDSHLGLARDWDIASLGIIWLVIFIMVAGLRSIKNLPNWRSILTPIVLLSLILSTPWLIINHLSRPSLIRYQDLLRARPGLKGTAWGYEILALHYKSQNDSYLAALNYEAAARHSPKNWRHWYNAGVAYLKIKDLENALIDLRIARRLNPREPDIFTNLGCVFLELKMVDSTLTAFKMAYTLDSLKIPYMNNLGLAYYWNGLYDEAKAMFERILLVQPFQYNASLGLVDVLIAQNELKQAELILNKLMPLFKGDPEVISRRYKIDSLLRR